MEEKDILKYLKGEVTLNEAKQIEDWVNASPENTKTFNLLKAQYIASTFDETAKKVSIDEEYDKFNAKLESKTVISINRKLYATLKYAAVLIVAFGLGYFYYTKNNTDDLIPEDAITLQLEDGTIKVITENETSNITDSEGNILGQQQGKTLVYDEKTEVEKLVYNTLTVPYGRTFNLKLSDGTHVYLNAGTSMRYPIKFIQGKDREVFVEGEAYFKVLEDKTHPFIAHTDAVNIRVLGTQFNIASYPEDDVVNTVLVEGSVSVYDTNQTYDPSKSTMLTPGHKAAWNRHNKKITVQQTDINLHTAWINGRIVFRDLPFKNIRKKLERHYNVTIVNNNKDLEENTCNAVFDIETIDQVMETLSKYYGVTYTFQNNIITIN